MLREWPAFEALAKSFAEGEVCLRVAGLTGAARALAVAELLQAHPRPALVVVADLAAAHRWTQDLKVFGASVLEFPPPEPRLWRGGHHREADAERAVIARRLAVGDLVAVVATPAALSAPLWSRDEFAARTLRLATGDSLDRELLLEALERCGYERVETVVAVGPWSPRGGIRGIFSPGQARPARRGSVSPARTSSRSACSIRRPSARSERSTSFSCSRCRPRTAHRSPPRACSIICRRRRRSSSICRSSWTSQPTRRWPSRRCAN